MAIPAHSSADVYGVVFVLSVGGEEVKLGGQRKVNGDVRALESVSRFLALALNFFVD